MTYDFVFNGISTADYGIYAFPSKENSKPAERDTTTVDVHGRDGALTVDNKRYKNKPLKYTCILTDKRVNYDEFISRLTATIGFFRLEDTTEIDTYYKARYNGVEIIREDSDAIKFSVKFDAKPYKYLKFGDEIIGYDESGTIYNSTYFPSKPLLRAYGIGTVHIGDYSVTINTADGYTDIDCESLNCYKGDVSCGENVVISNNEFPLIEPGEINVELEGITRLEIIPRWCTA